MSKIGFCPICKTSIKREGRRDRATNIRTNVVPMHYRNNVVCGGSLMEWEKAIRKRTYYKITIKEITDATGLT